MIVLEQDYHIKKDLEKARILCIDHKTALQEDIRALRIGILNIMPKAESYEFSILHPLGRSVMQIEPVWIRLKSHAYNSSNPAHLKKLYVPFEKAIRTGHLDGLIITGAPVEEIPFAEVSYWQEITRILKYARTNIPSTLGLCWGGLALARFLGIDKTVLPRKLFGVYEMENLDTNHRITGNMDDLFWCPQSRHSGIPDDVMRKFAAEGKINLLAYSSLAGYSIFESADHRFIMHLGHPEYEPARLIEEYNRDREAGREDVNCPVNLDLKRPVNRWRGHRTEFFSQWIKYIHDATSY